jgi:glycosyltransferase involved in cell wall biosynthesis
MANILVNGLNLSLGGGKNILDNYIKQCCDRKLNHTYFFLTPNYDFYKVYCKENLVIIKIEKIYTNNFFFIFLYFYKFPRLLRKFHIDVIFNLGDVIIPTKISQIYFFDWAYAVYSEDYIWNRMSFKDFLQRKIKVFLIDRYIKRVNTVIAQTDNVSNRLKFKYNLENVRIIATPLGVSFSKTDSNYDFKLPESLRYFLFPASYSSHKNFDVILRLGKLISEEKLPFLIVLTLDEIEASDFLSKLKNEKLDCFFNVGKVDGVDMPALYQRCDVLLFPTLLETYGLPYLEAMALKKPILTSNLDFAMSVCGDVAYYFDPFSSLSIINVMKQYSHDPVDLEKRLEAGRRKTEAIPDWYHVFMAFENEIDILIS